MKKILAFTTAALIVFTSCNWSSTNNSAPKNPLEGSWKFDSITPGKDSGLASFITAFTLTENPGGLRIRFSPDSIYTSYRDGDDTVSYRFNQNDNRLIADKDSLRGMYQFATLNDSLVSLTANDSTVLYLRKL